MCHKLDTYVKEQLQKAKQRAQQPKFIQQSSNVSKPANLSDGSDSDSSDSSISSQDKGMPFPKQPAGENPAQPAPVGKSSVKATELWKQQNKEDANGSGHTMRDKDPNILQQL